MTKGGEATVRRRRAWLLSLAALEPPCRPVERFSPTWWAAWTCALHRPGRLGPVKTSPATGLSGLIASQSAALEADAGMQDREQRQEDRGDAEGDDAVT